jgi:hypothetical protein
MKFVLFISGLFILNTLWGQNILNENKLKIKNHVAYTGDIPYTGIAFGTGFQHHYLNGLREGEFKETYYSVYYKENKAKLFKYYDKKNQTILSVKIDSINFFITNVKFKLICKGAKNDTLKLGVTATFEPVIIYEIDYKEVDTLHLNNFSFKGMFITASFNGSDVNDYIKNNTFNTVQYKDMMDNVWCWISPSSPKYKNTEIELSSVRLFLSK